MNLFARVLRAGALILAFAGLPSVASAKTILVFSPHPDDEALVAAGHVRAALAAGHTVKIILLTNGDFQGVQSGLARQGESVAAAQILGLTEQDVIFLGYPDGALMQIYNAPSPTDIVTSNAGQTQTYGERGMGGMDYHRFRFGSPGAYNRVTLEQDIRTLLAEYLPDEIYTVSHFDMHPDHQAAAVLVTEALVALKRSGVPLATKLHQGIVWTPSQDNWPEAGGCSPDTPFPPPQMETQLEWKRTLRAVVAANLKCQAIGAFASQATPHLLSFARKDEFFWLSDFGANLALTAQVTASSEASAAQGRMKAVDGFIDGAHRDAAREWVSASELAGAWIQLDWSAAVSVSQVNLHDRPLGGENVLAGTLSFSDGTSIAVGALPADGKLLPLIFAPKTVTWVRFTIDQAQGAAAGLSEIQLLGVAAAQSAANVAPHILEGPGGNSDKSIISAETATFAVQAHDLNGDTLQYQWSADGGTIQGSGASAVFTPPAVTASTLFTITAQILDGRGGSASSVGFVTVAPAVDALTLNPASVFGGGSAQGTVTLAIPAPSGGLSVPLSSSNPAASVPPSVTVPAGTASASFPIATSVVGARIDLTISANIRGTLRSAALAVTPQPSPVPPANLLLSPDRIGDANWLNLGPIRSTLHFAAAPDGTQNASRVETTASGGHALAQVVSVAASTSYILSFYARNNGGSAAAYSVHCSSLGTDVIPATSYIGAINGSGWTQVSATFTTPAGCTQIAVYPVRDSGAPVDVLLWRAILVPSSSVPVPPVLSSIALSPATVAGGASVTGTATLSAAAPAGGAQVALSSNNSAAAVPANVTVAAGATSATFSVATSPVAAPAAVTISGSYGGATQTGSLTVVPPGVAALSLSQGSVTGGTGVTGTVTLSGPAPAGGAQVMLSDNSGAASTPASVTVAAGATSASFSVGTSAVAVSTSVTVSASYGGGSQSVSLTVLPAALVSLSVSPTSVIGAPILGNSTGRVTLNGPAPAGGAVVTLSDNSAACSRPATVTIPAGATSATFTVTTGIVLISTTCTVTGTYQGTSRSAALQITL
jgi:LmbE family N-acetylglucosaminyl deacetylase